MTVAQFYRNEGVSQPSFYKWKKKLGQLPSSKPVQDTTDVQFLPVQLTGPAEQADGAVNQQSHRDGPDEVLAGYEGNLIGDCWSGLQKIDIRGDSRITFAACWAHARRKIDECRSAFPIQVAKLESLIRVLYDVEDQLKDLGDAERLARRVSLSRGALDLIAEYLDSEPMQSPSVLPKSNLGVAASYVRRHWSALCRFTEDPSIPLDNHDCEQLMKRSVRDYRQDERRQAADRNRTRRAHRRLLAAKSTRQP